MRKRKKKRYRARAAYHEAGHAVANFYFGRPVKFITIVATEKAGGLTVLHRTKPSDIRNFRRPRYYVEREIICCLAGPAAEEHYMGGDGGIEMFYSLRDYQGADRLAEQYCPRPEEADAFAKCLYQRAVTFISSEPYWSAVSSIAKALMTHGRVSGRKAQRIYDKCCVTAASSAALDRRGPLASRA